MKSLGFLVAASTFAYAGAKKPPAPAALEDPCVDGAACKRHALDAFRDALAAQRAGTASHPLRVSYFGDSLTADDHITGDLREKLQALLGDGGPGFVFAVPPHPYCEHRAVLRVVSEGWHVHGISTVVPPDRLLGLGGSAESEGEATIRLVPTGPVSTLELHYLAQPHGGTLDIAVDNKVVETISTAGEAKKGAFATVALPPGKGIELRAKGRVRLFGASLEADRGAVVDNLGVVNATAKAMRNHNLDEHWRNQLAHRDSNLVVIMYGTNEAEWLRPSSAGMAEHEKLFGELLGTVREALPEASCLVVSPLDQLDFEDAKMPPRDSIPAMVAAQRRAALAHGCAFWDTYTWMGGKGASRSWFARGLIVKDFQHPTTEGAQQIADALYAGLIPDAE
ncbi:MAG TPA: GDSL-type esterase/lipase family protein [Kofleriaceae bacterium]|nr:GDSL-type esterase/lipase family protein [Kofleriaceae bacterium]